MRSKVFLSILLPSITAFAQGSNNEIDSDVQIHQVSSALGDLETVSLPPYFYYLALEENRAGRNLENG
jgi:hypothetical protein